MGTPEPPPPEWGGVGWGTPPPGWGDPFEGPTAGPRGGQRGPGLVGEHHADLPELLGDVQRPHLAPLVRPRVVQRGVLLNEARLHQLDELRGVGVGTFLIPNVKLFKKPVRCRQNVGVMYVFKNTTQHAT